MSTAQAISTHRVRVRVAPEPSTVPSVWTCTIRVPPAMPLLVVGVDRGESFLDITVDHAMTPGAAYALNQGAQAFPFTGYESPSLAERRLLLGKLLPRYAQAADESGDQAAVIVCLQDIVDHLTMRIEQLGNANDMEATEAPLGAMLDDLGNPFSLVRGANSARRLIPVLVQLYRQKGTARGLKNAIRALVGTEVAEVRRVERYGFVLKFPRTLSDQDERHVRSVVAIMKPAHTHLSGILYPPSLLVASDSAADPDIN